MDVFIANFGKGNCLWDECRSRPSIATMNESCCQPFWLAGDREGFLSHAAEAHRTASGTPAPRATASRWFNLMTTVQASRGDLWIHKAGDEIWWTRTNDDPAAISELPTYEEAMDRHVIYCHKPCEPWSKTDGKGNPLTWKGLHPKARDFLSTEGTLQRLSDDYASYSLALVDGADLGPWHSRKLWSDILQTAKTKPGRTLIGAEKAAHDMAAQAEATARSADGRVIERNTKVKDWGFRDYQHAVEHIRQLLAENDNRCALTGLQLQFRETCDDEQMLCSLDRIDSDGHYAPGNVQVVCRFANFWKSAQDNDEFLRLLDIVRQRLV